MSDETLEREAEACVTFNYPAMDRDFQQRLYFFYSKEESAWRFCHRKLQKAYPLEGTEHMDEAYHQKWFHAKGMLFPGIIFALIPATLVGWLITVTVK